MKSSPEKAGFGAFNALAGYIFGSNKEQVKMAMTTPVINHGTTQKMSFVMPSNYWKTDAATPPTPMEGSGVTLENRGGGMIGSSSQVAVVWFGGFASKQLVAQKKALLTSSLQQDAEWTAVDESAEPLLLQYNDPFVPPWKRRNEVALAVTARVAGVADVADAPPTTAASAGTQLPPAAKLALPNAKLAAAEVNKRQWGVGAESVESAGVPEGKLELPMAKLQAVEVNMKQWGIGREDAGAALAPTPGPVATEEVEQIDYMAKLNQIRKCSLSL
jgi:hypothetical protein